MLRDKFASSKDEEGHIPVSTANKNRVRATRSCADEEVAHLAHTIRIGTTREEVGVKASRIIDALNGNSGRTESTLQTVTRGRANSGALEKY